MYFTETPILKEARILKENLKFYLFKLQSNTEDICALTSLEDKKKCHKLYGKYRKSQHNNKLENYLNQMDVEILSVISAYRLEHYYNAQLAAGRSVNSKSFSKDSSKGSSKKESVALIQNESRAKQKLELLKGRQKLKRTQAEEDYLRVKEFLELTQASDVSVSDEVLRNLETLGQIKNTCAEFFNRHI